MIANMGRMMIAYLRCAPLATVLIWGVGSACRSAPTNNPRQTNGLPTLKLTQVAAYRLPGNANVRGALALSNDRILFWTPRGAWEFEQARETIRPVCPGQLRGIIGAGQVGSAVEVLDTTRQGIFEVVDRDRCRLIRAVDVGGLIEAAPIPQGWLAVGRPGAVGPPRLRVLKNTGEHVDLEYPRMLKAYVDSTDQDWVYLSPAPGGAFLGHRRWPFPWVRVDPQGESATESAQGAASGARSELLTTLALGEGYSTWHALPPLDLGTAYLQVLADLGSDRRILRVFDRSGRLSRDREIVAPLGFFAADPGTQLLVGLRVSDVTELVVYRWRWHPTAAEEEQQ